LKWGLGLLELLCEAEIKIPLHVLASTFRNRHRLQAAPVKVNRHPTFSIPRNFTFFSIPRLLKAATDHNLCIYPFVDSDLLFDKIRNSPEFKAVRQAGIDCRKKFEPYAEIEIQ